MIGRPLVEVLAGLDLNDPDVIYLAHRTPLVDGRDADRYRQPRPDAPAGTRTEELPR